MFFSLFAPILFQLRDAVFLRFSFPASSKNKILVYWEFEQTSDFSLNTLTSCSVFNKFLSFGRNSDLLRCDVTIIEYRSTCVMTLDVFYNPGSPHKKILLFKR
ncbi:hypothetical protein CR513_51873, partial [Mucuna pruriens]